MIYLKALLIWFLFIPAAMLNGLLCDIVVRQALGEKLVLPLSGVLMSLAVDLK